MTTLQLVGGDGMADDTQDQGLALDHLRVIDLGGPAVQFCARLLGDFGADVIKIEPPGGDSARHQGPYVGGAVDPERSLYFINHNHNKRSVVLDLETEEGRDTLKRLARTADVLIESFPPGHLDEIGLGHDDLSRENPALLYASITLFGHTGPNRDFQATELTVQSMTAVTYIHGDDQAPPCLVPSEQLLQVSAYHTFYGILAALQARHRTARGQHVDVSMQDVGVWLLMMVLGEYSLNQVIRRRSGAASSNPAVSIYRTRDDAVVQVAPYMDHHFKALIDWMQHPVLLGEEWSDPMFRRDKLDVIDQFVQEFIQTLDAREFVAEAQRRGIPATPIQRISEFVQHPQPREREWFTELEHPLIGSYTAAGAPYRLSETPWSVRRPAPRLGEHTDEVLRDLKTPIPAGAATQERPGAASITKPLEGVRIADFTQAVAGPVATMLLGFLGAEVIKVETSNRPQPRRPEQPGFAELNRNKLSASINAQDPQGYEMALRLIAQSDVVIDNFRPGVMDRMNLGYEKLREIKPDIIVVQMPGMGTTGPIKDYLCYGHQLFGLSGLGYIWGHPGSDQVTRPKLGYTDYVAGSATVGATILALEHRHRTGQGQLIEVAQLEALAATLGTHYLDYTVNGVDAEPQGNLSERYAPHSVYSCLGFDAWCSIVCRDDDEWLRLVATMGQPGWAGDERFATVQGRLDNREELDRRITEWTSGLTSRQVMLMLQRAGIPAGAVQSPEDLLRDPHLRSRGSIALVQAPPPWNVPLEHPALPPRLSDTPGSSDGPAPAEGGDNDYVFRHVMGLSDDEITRLVESGALR